MRKEIRIGWQNGTESIITHGLTTGDELVLTSLGQVSSGTPVAVAGQTSSSNPKKDEIPEERLKKLQKIANQRDITVEALIAERQANKKQIAKSNQASKVNN